MLPMMTNWRTYSVATMANAPAFFHESRPKANAAKVWRTTRDYIGVVSIEGPIMHGTGGGRLPLPVPFLDGRVSADRPLSRLLRSVEREADMAALIIHVDSGGGDAFASDVIYREVKRLARRNRCWFTWAIQRLRVVLYRRCW